jgi:hypothetical protein
MSDHSRVKEWLRNEKPSKTKVVDTKSDEDQEAVINRSGKDRQSDGQIGKLPNVDVMPEAFRIKERPYGGQLDDLGSSALLSTNQII